MKIIAHGLWDTVAASTANHQQLALVRDGDQQKPEWVEHSLGLQSPLSRVRTDGSEPLEIQVQFSDLTALEAIAGRVPAVTDVTPETSARQW